jgi:hypothetical protein
MSQTVALTSSWEPTLAFWYRPADTDADGDTFRVTLTAIVETSNRAPALGVVPASVGRVNRLAGVTEVRTYVITPSLEVADWQHVGLSLGSEEYLNGSVTLQFQMRDDGDTVATTVYVDEVSLGRTPGGPHKSYLPVALRGK